MTYEAALEQLRKEQARTVFAPFAVIPARGDDVFIHCSAMQLTWHILVRTAFVQILASRAP